MSEKYIFNTSKYSIESNKNFIYGDVIILTQVNNYSGNLYLTLRFENDKQFYIKNIKIVSDILDRYTEESCRAYLQ